MLVQSSSEPTDEKSSWTATAPLRGRQASALLAALVSELCRLLGSSSAILRSIFLRFPRLVTFNSYRSFAEVNARKAGPLISLSFSTSAMPAKSSSVTQNICTWSTDHDLGLVGSAAVIAEISLRGKRALSADSLDRP